LGEIKPNKREAGWWATYRSERFQSKTLGPLMTVTTALWRLEQQAAVKKFILTAPEGTRRAKVLWLARVLGLAADLRARLVGL